MYPSGFHKHVFPDGSVYEGSWLDYKKHGSGTNHYAAGGSYTGEFANGLRHGTGSYIYPDGDIYIGDFNLGNREGRGKYIFMGGGHYEGEWLADQMHGLGSAVDASGKTLSGWWRNGRPAGQVLCPLSPIGIIPRLPRPFFTLSSPHPRPPQSRIAAAIHPPRLEPACGGAVGAPSTRHAHSADPNARSAGCRTAPRWNASPTTPPTPPPTPPTLPGLPPPRRRPCNTAPRSPPLPRRRTTTTPKSRRRVGRRSGACRSGPAFLRGPRG